MKKIALLSDNHSWPADELWPYLEGIDEVWHAGDMGSFESIDPLIKAFGFRGVYGNVDNAQLRAEFGENNIFEIEGVKVVMTHIGGYPGRYKSRVKDLLEVEKPDLYICGHSHILKVVRDNKLDLLHMNPGAYGHHGFHKVRTFLRFTIDGVSIKDLNVVELGLRGRSL